MRYSLAVVLAAVSWVIACSAQDRRESTEIEPSQSASSSQNEPVAIMPRGERITLEIAANSEARARGLMFRDHLPPDRGMLFLFPRNDVFSFWMKNTLIPLDMIWLDEQNRIVHIAANVPPCAADPCPSYSPGKVARSVLELAAGRAAELRLVPGQSIQIRNIDSYRVE